MSSDRIDQLSPRERECLRHVHRGLSSKQIAKVLGISHHTVDDHLKSAIQVLGARSRFEAGRMLADHERTPPMLGTQPADVDFGERASAEVPPDRSNGQPWRARLPFLRREGSSNDLTLVQRLAWIIILAVALIFALSQFADMLAVVLSIARGRG